MHFDKNFLKTVLPKAELLYDTFPNKVSFSIDSRTLNAGDIFVAIIGKEYDGHDFVLAAIENGASGLLISKKDCLSTLEKNLLNNKCVIIVEDTVLALRKLGMAWRSQFNYPVLAITGSVGKTSTKQIIENMFKLHGLKVLVTRGNQNTLIGVPLNLLRMTNEYDIAVFELGINARGEMAMLVEMVKPTMALITSVGHSHMEGLGSVTDVASEKRQVFKFFKEDNIGIVNGDQPQLGNIGYNHPVIKFGSKITNQIQARKIKVDKSQVHFILKIYKTKYNITLNHNHIGFVYNSLAAIAVGCLLNIPNDTMIKAITMPIEVTGRFEMKPMVNGKGNMIDDCYNASPESMKAALLAFEKLETKATKIAVLGDMLELGPDSSFWHRQIGRFLRKVPSLGYLILVGDMVKWVKATLPVRLNSQLVLTWQEAIDILKAKTEKNECLVLVKGSTRGHKSGLVNLVKHFTESNAQEVKLANKQKTAEEINI